jgi:nicotinate-nucleotide--dimethylbenzimidazole phosphoribosyltransferase
VNTLTRAQVQAHLDQKTKPPGSLGRLEQLAIELCLMQDSLEPAVDPARALIFAADHGISHFQVSAYPRAVTMQMMHNFEHGGAAINVLARSAGVPVEVIDVGVDADLSALKRITHAKVARGSRALQLEDALTDAELQAALEVGQATARRAHAQGVQTLILGEMGIGNTTSASALLAALSGSSVELCVGAGTGVSGAQREHKVSLIKQGLSRADLSDARSIMRALGGLELAALTGAILSAHRARQLVLVDGFIVTVAALCAVRLRPETRACLSFAHQSAEAGHRLALAALQAEPLLDWQLRLGEGSGAMLAFPLLRAAAAIAREMASFASAGVANRSDH